MTISETVSKYPSKDGRWRFDNVTCRFVTEASLFNDDVLKDPWKRNFPNGVDRELKDTREDEVIGWVYKTTVAGVEVSCVVFND